MYVYIASITGVNCALLRSTFEGQPVVLSLNDNITEEWKKYIDEIVKYKSTHHFVLLCNFQEILVGKSK